MDFSDSISINTYNIRNYPSLPYNGWLKVCSNKNCRAITGGYVYYELSNIKFKFYFCHNCIKKIDTNKCIENHYYSKMLTYIN